MQTLKQSVKRLFLIAIAMTLLSATAISVYATIYFVGQYSDGTTS